jgi:hypothetical protein
MNLLDDAISNKGLRMLSFVSLAFIEIRSEIYFLNHFLEEQQYAYVFLD